MRVGIGKRRERVMAVWWLDSHSSPGWADSDEVARFVRRTPKERPVLSVGIVTRSTRKALYLAQSVNYCDSASELLCIPRFAIQRMEVLAK